MKNNSGFTLVELVTVVLILGILVVSAIPESSLSTGYNVITERDQVISLLRTAQTRSMQNTENDCNRVIFTSSAIYIAAKDSSDSSGATCSASPISTSDDDMDSYLTVRLQSPFTVANMAFDGTNSFIDFEPYYGRPNSSSSPPSRVTITIDGSETICVETEGYIHVC